MRWRISAFLPVWSMSIEIYTIIIDKDFLFLLVLYTVLNFLSLIFSSILVFCSFTLWTCNAVLFSTQVSFHFFLKSFTHYDPIQDMLCHPLRVYLSVVLGLNSLFVEGILTSIRVMSFGKIKRLLSRNSNLFFTGVKSSPAQ